MSDPKMFQVGDIVEWSSSAGGVTKTKRGNIAAVLADGQRPWQTENGVISELLSTHDSHPVNQSSAGRKGDSYLVSVKQNKNCKRKLYWPLVSKLRHAT